MKKIIVAILVTLVEIGCVSAAEITEEKISNVYANQNYNGKELSASFGYMYADNDIAYCIDPGIPLKIGYYDRTYDFNYKNIDKEKKEKLELIAYYGYQFPNHNTEKYYYATQALIWETIGSNNISFTTSRNRQGTIIDISSEKKEILKKVNEVLLLPSFANTKVEGNLGETIVLEDSNHNYFNFGYTSNNKNSYNFNNDKFNIKLNELGAGQIKITKKLNSVKKSTLFYSSGYQSVVTFGIDVSKEAFIEVNVNDPNRVKLRINNYDKNSNEVIYNSAFKIKNMETEEYLKYEDNDIFYTNNEGFLVFPEYLNSGKYLIEQFSVNQKYIINNNTIIFYVDEEINVSEFNGEKYLVIDFFNEKIKSNNIFNEKEYIDAEKLPKTSDRYLNMSIVNILMFLIGFIGLYEIKINKIY